MATRPASDMLRFGGTVDPPLRSRAGDKSPRALPSRVAGPLSQVQTSCPFVLDGPEPLQVGRLNRVPVIALMYIIARPIARWFGPLRFSAGRYRKLRGSSWRQCPGFVGRLQN